MDHLMFRDPQLDKIIEEIQIHLKNLERYYY